MSDSLGPHRLEPARLLCPWDSSGKNTGVGCHFLLQELFLTQGLNPYLLRCGQILHHLGHQQSPRILEWVTYPFPRESSGPQNRTGVSCIAGGFFTSLATREALNLLLTGKKRKKHKLKVENYVLFGGLSENLSLPGILPLRKRDQQKR